MKRAIRKLGLSLVPAMALAALFSACGDDSGSNSSRHEEPSPEVAELELANGKAVVCDDDMEGVVAITADDGYRKCVDGEWIKIRRLEAMKADKIIGQLDDEDDDDNDGDDIPNSSSSVIPSDSEGSSSSKGSSSVTPTEYVVDSYEDLPVCTAKREGSTAEVEDTGKKYKCEDGEWLAIKTTAKSSSSVIPNTSSSVIPNSSGVIPSDSEGSSSSKGGSSVLYKCPDGTVVANLENCKTPSSSPSDTPNTSASETPGTSASETPGTSSGVIPGTDPESPSEVKADGYYSNSENCPAGLTCKYATTTEYLNSSKTYGEILDTRDGQVYKTVTIGTQTWMAENLNYDPGNVSSMGSYAWSGCYNNESSNCSKYGRLYTWEVAMDNADCAYDKKCNASLKPATPVRGVCPSGWHLPSHYEFEELINFIDPDFGYNHTDYAYSSKAGLYLKSQSGWNSSGNGSDAYGFSALPGGNRDGSGSFYNAGDVALFWSSGECNSYDAFFLDLNYSRGNAYLGWYDKYDARSVRCLKDSPDQGGEISSSSSAPTEDPRSSSSVIQDPVLGKTAWDYLNQDMLVAGKYGELLDNRDGQVYKTIEICDKNDKNCQTWMAQNLNYDPGNVSSMGSYAWSGCYNKESANCSKYGRLYTWEVAMNKAECGYGTYCNNSYEGTQGVCPAGWHLPSNGEWSALYDNIGGTSNAGSLLKSTSGWNYGGNGTDKYGFSVLPAGYRYDRGYFTSSGNNAYFWSSSENDRSIAWRQHFDYRAGYVDQYDSYEDVAFSIRCLKDSPDQGGEASNSSSSGSSASETPGTSSGVIPGTDPESPSEVKHDGYYSNSSNCPIGLNCKYASTTEYLNSTKTYGEILDTRDGQVYKTIEICDEDNKNCQTWMAQNLNYAYTGVKYNYNGYTSDSTSWCYDDDPSNCATYGRLYTWAAAVDSVAIYKNYSEKCGYGKSCTRFSATALATAPVRGVCPSGWHLPSNAEWSTLYTNVGEIGTAGQKLKANTSRWDSNTGTDEYGFSVLPAGSRSYFVGDFYNQGNALFWSSTENESSSNNAWYQGFSDSYGGVGQYDYDKGDGFSVRCLKD